MDWQNFLFGFDGRINRSKYWLFTFTAIAILIISILVAYVAARVTSSATSAFLFIVVPVWLFLIYVGCAVGTKRLHDRGKSGWWLLLFYLVPAIFNEVSKSIEGIAELVLATAAFFVTIWAIVELGVLRGTNGPNKYGPSSLASRTIPE